MCVPKFVVSPDSTDIIDIATQFARMHSNLWCMSLNIDAMLAPTTVEKMSEFVVETRPAVDELVAFGAEVDSAGLFFHGVLAPLPARMRNIWVWYDRLRMAHASDYTDAKACTALKAEIPELFTHTGFSELDQMLDELSAEEFFLDSGEAIRRLSVGAQVEGLAIVKKLWDKLKGQHRHAEPIGVLEGGGTF